MPKVPDIDILAIAEEAGFVVNMNQVFSYSGDDITIEFTRFASAMIRGAAALAKERANEIGERRAETTLLSDRQACQAVGQSVESMFNKIADRKENANA